MRTNVWPLLVGVAVLGSAGAVDAADVAASTERKVVVLTDTQMDGVTAGHLARSPANNKVHSGKFWEVGLLYIGNGPHTGCGNIRCDVARAGIGAVVGGAIGFPGDRLPCSLGRPEEVSSVLRSEYNRARWGG